MIQPSPVNELTETLKVMNKSKVLSGLRLLKKKLKQCGWVNPEIVKLDLKALKLIMNQLNHS